MMSGVRHSHQHLAINEIGTSKFTIASPASPSTMHRWALCGTEVQVKKKRSEKRHAGVLETGTVRSTPGIGGLRCRRDPGRDLAGKLLHPEDEAGWSTRVTAIASPGAQVHREARGSALQQGPKRAPPHLHRTCHRGQGHH